MILTYIIKYTEYENHIFKINVCLSVCLFVTSSLENGWTDFYETWYILLFSSDLNYRLYGVTITILKWGVVRGHKVKKSKNLA